MLILREMEYSKISRAMIAMNLIALLVQKVETQSIGYHPHFNLGFNPYSSQVFGYGLGLPFGAYNLSPARNPLLLGSISASAPFTDKHGFMGKIHAKAFLNKLATNQLINLSAYPLGAGSIKDKLNVLKYPNYALSPYGNGYGFGKHYGSALVPNNPYKSVYADYYDSHQHQGLNRGKISVPLKTDKLAIPTESSLLMGETVLKPNIHNSLVQLKSYSHYLKPIIKTGAFLTSLMLLGKKALEMPANLHPSGMILHETEPYN